MRLGTTSKVIGDQKDPEDVGFVQWRSVFYCAGDLTNFLLLLDGFFAWTPAALILGTGPKGL